MGFFDRIRQTADLTLRGLTGEGLTEEALASLTPEQRAAYDAQMSRVAEAQQEVIGNQRLLERDHQARVDARPLQGPAGEFLYGPTAYPGTTDVRSVLDLSGAEQIEHSMQVSKAQLADVLRNPWGREAPAPPPPPGGVDHRPPARVQADERAARDAAKQPYLAPDRWPVTTTRIATRGRTQVQEVAAFLASSGLAGRPDLVYGLYRVPDRISPNLGGSEKSRVVEWDVVHAATEALPPAAEPQVAWFDGRDRWVARRTGDPSIVDEDLALNYLVSAGIGPEQTIGIARQLSTNSYSSGDDSNHLWCHVDGLQVFHAPGLGRQVHEQMAAARPLPIGVGPPLGTHLEVLDWDCVRQCVHPARHQPPLLPSPFPYLPSTPQEVLQAYLEVVGVRPGDSWSVQATRSEAGALVGTGRTGFISYETNAGPAQPCADGKARRRMAGTEHLVVAYRDRPEYVAGRERWVAFMRDAYQGDLARGVVLRGPVPAPDDDGLPRGLRALAKVATVVDAVTDGFEQGPTDHPVRWCWPATDRT